MKTFIGFTAMLMLGHSAAALEFVGCVSPKTRVMSNGNLELRFISVYGKPQGRPIDVKIAAPMSLYVLQERGAWLELGGSPSSPFKEGQTIGWVKRRRCATSRCEIAIFDERRRNATPSKTSGSALFVRGQCDSPDSYLPLPNGRSLHENQRRRSDGVVAFGRGDRCDTVSNERHQLCLAVGAGFGQDRFQVRTHCSEAE